MLVDGHERRHRARHPARRRPRPHRRGHASSASTRPRSWPPTVHHATIYATGLVDLERHVVIDMVEGNSAADLRRWTDQRRPGLAGRHRGGGHRPGRVVPGRAVAAARPRPPGRRPVPRRAGRATAASTRSAAGCRTRPSATVAARHDPLYRIRKLLLTGAERLDERGSRPDAARACASATPTTSCSAPGWPRNRSATSTSPTPRPTPRRCSTRPSPAAPPTRWPRSARSARPSRRGAPRSSPTTTPAPRNGPTEGLNLCVKKVKRCGHGFRSLRALPAPRAAPRRRHHLARADPARHASEPALPTQTR